MSTKFVWWTLAVGVLLLLGGATVAGFLSNVQAGNAVAVLGLVSATALGIERVLEMFWEFAGQLAHSWWPLSVPGKRLDDLTATMNTTMQPYVNSIKEQLASVNTALSNDERERIKKYLDEITGYFNKFTLTSPPSQQAAATIMALVNSVATSVETGVTKDHEAKTEKGTPPSVNLKTVTDSLNADAEKVKKAVAGVASFADTFADNPARKIISLFAGSVMGLGIASFTGLDIFHASSMNSTLKLSGLSFLGLSNLSFNWGVVITGLVMGLGSNPTHALITAVQETYKKK